MASHLHTALAAAPDRPTPKADPPDEEVFIFRLADLVLGVTSSRVREVTRLGSITPLPRTPSFILGAVGHRGEVLPLIDLLRFFGQGEARPTVRSRVLMCDHQGASVALLADAIVGLRRVLLADRLPPPVGAGSHAEFLVGIVQTRDLGGTLSLVDVSKVIVSARNKAAHR